MALPQKLRIADITRFATRAQQLETANPAVAYWCEYYMINQILGRKLHTSDGECMTYTTTLMDKLEHTKMQYAASPEITDDVAGQAYVEQFGLSTFERADRAVRANKVSKQTADTFLAAATFLELLNIWGEPSQEVVAKIRYAKWNAVRIVKAIKEGTDPNESNPRPEPEPEVILQPLDPNDPEVMALGGMEDMQPTVEDVPDEGDGANAEAVTQHQLLSPSHQASAIPSPLAPGEAVPAGDREVSPLEETPNPRNGSLGGGYFPEVPVHTHAYDDANSTASDLPSMPPPADLHIPSENAAREGPGAPPSIDDFYRSAASPIVQGSSIPPTPTTQPSSFQNPPEFISSTDPPSTHSSTPAPPPVSQASTNTTPQPPTYIPRPTSSILPTSTPKASPAPSFPPTSLPKPAAAPPIAPPTAPSTSTNTNNPPSYNTDDISIARAQKHARFAISALNFDDVATAVRELRGALEVLGVR